jgi:U6 snRNA-associated Sm-like protein LSm7
LAPYVDKKLRVKFVGGREVIGVLRGADPICNMVLDETIEILRGNSNIQIILFLDAKDPYKLTEETRELGILIARGPTVYINSQSNYAIGSLNMQ